MLAIALIVFRESLEAALIVSIVLVASVGIPKRAQWVASGVAAGVAGALLVAVFAAGISDAFAGSGQELLNAVILMFAVAMLGWHNLWMASHARAAAREVRAIGRSVADGSRPMLALAAIPAVAVLREGAETVLFVFGIATASDGGAAATAAGTLSGLAGGVGLGALLYVGLLRIPLASLFAVTGWMVLLLAAGLASDAASLLVQADLLPPLGDTIWDSSFLLTEDSLPGRILHTLVGYVARPQGIQLLAYVTTLAVLGLSMLAVTRSRRSTVPA